MYFIAGLILVTIGWVIQFYKTAVSKDKNINPYFLVLYFIGVFFLVIGNLIAGDVASCLLNLISGILPLLILLTLIRD
ncbi:MULTISPECIES: hypothetical protein [Methanobacterium]|jgi:uncharacterized protein with PQ loop repeat|uniref:Uncharacterized protein n=1 Tax=Methanobacterium subterraneum TaxID=59277 RepID=A0A7K4DL25_9EURY|nr:MULTISPECIES: hypothetical protein [Methanobacterium]AUB58846.1 hypothetical protein BK008_11355 [Methanobacterium sp. MZ-A1]MBW4257534.1 hypothetical protein [Methanobacterium sp. YSL]NMO09100.1 hypothetical protein [Methanobacterium subterraneum]PKL71074.1 MAG: hypothetical protein CVV29_12530 [Methanobacteriales archaeon HGW-Methanobacteriales-2]